MDDGVGVGMIRIAIVEDEELYAAQLESFLHQYEAEKKEGFVITRYRENGQPMCG